MSLYTATRSLLAPRSRQETQPNQNVLKSSTRSPLRKRDVASRVCAAFFGGYAAASAVSMLLARVMPLPRADATTTAILLTPILYLAAILCAFSTALPSRAWTVLVAITVIAGGATYAFILSGGRL